MRFRNKLIFFKNKFFKNPRIFRRISSKSGRNYTGRLCVLSKQHRPSVRVPSFRLSLPFNFLNFFLSWNETSTFNNKRYSVYEGRNSVRFVLPKVQNNTVGSYYRFKLNKLMTITYQNRLSEINLGLPCFLKFVPFFYIVSNLFFIDKPKCTYAVSSGTSCVKIPNEKRSKFLKIIMPSDQEKFFDYKTLCILGKNPFAEKKLYKPGKAGIFFLKGKKPKVRGVARNPVDHPNGGRTKSCSPEMSPWGWVAKKNK